MSCPFCKNDVLVIGYFDNWCRYCGVNPEIGTNIIVDGIGEMIYYEVYHRYDGELYCLHFGISNNIFKIFDKINNVLISINSIPKITPNNIDNKVKIYLAFL